MTSTDGLSQQWQAYKQQPFAVVGLLVEDDYDEADWALFDSSLAGYIERAIGSGGLTPAEAREVERLGAEVREQLASLTLETGQTQMRLLAALADAALRYRR